MKKLTVSIDMSNAAFADDGNDGRTEAARILKVIATKLEQGCDLRGLTIDHNGNNTGTWTIKGQPSAVNLSHAVREFTVPDCNRPFVS